MKREDKEYIYSLKRYILTITGIFIVSIIIGLAISEINPGLSEKYFKDFEESFGWIKDLNPLAIILVIFLNNAIKSLIALVLGVALGVISIIFVASNGIILGMVTYIVSREHGVLFVVVSLLPHGIIEIPMILISSGIGLRLGHDMYLSLTGGKIEIKKEMKQGVGFYFRWIAPLLFVAAVIETLPLIAIEIFS